MPPHNQPAEPNGQPPALGGDGAPTAPDPLAAEGEGTS